MEKYKKVFIFILAIFLNGLGIAATTRANLGTTPISSLPYVLTFMSPLSFGTTTFIINMLFLLAQKFVLKKDFKKRNYLQIVVTLFFGAFIDLGMHILAPLQTEGYFSQIVLLIIGSATLALGVSLETLADIMYVPGEGIVRAVNIKTGIEFGKLKIWFDILQCVIAIVLSLVVLHSVKGLREGTILSAFLVGEFVCLYYNLGLRKK